MRRKTSSARMMLQVVSSAWLFLLHAHADASPLTTVTAVLKSAGLPDSRVVLGECNAKSDAAAPHKMRSKGTLVLLHGRGGANQLESLPSLLQPIACKYNLRMAAPEAPNVQRNWPFEKMKGEGQDAFLMNLIENELPRLFKLDKTERKQTLVLVGISAGATFLMGDFYPRHGHKLRGRALALCGGSPPTVSKIERAETLKKNFPLFVQIGRADFLYEQVSAGLMQYAKFNLPLRAKVTNEAGHCNFDFNEAVEQALSMNTDE